MHYYKRHLGDYSRDTGHLSALEHGIYNLLLDWYYINECPIPDAKAKRIARGNPEETQMVLEEFFDSTPEGWRHARADREIAEYQVKADHNRTIGKLGGRPKKTQTVSERNPDVTLTINHKPLAIKELELVALPTAPPAADPKPKASKGNRLPADWTLPDEWAAWAKQTRPDLNPVDVAARFADHWHAKAGKDGVKLDWLATWRNWVRGEKSAAGGWQRHAEPRRIDTPEETRKRMSEIAPRRVSDPQTVSAALAANMEMLRGGSPE